MKKLTILLFSLFLVKTFAQDIPVKEIKTEVNEVTVFLNSAQVTSKKSIELEKGTTLLKFINLSPFIDAKSIQVKAKGEIMVLSVNHQQNYMEKTVKPEVLTDLQTRLKTIDESITTENAYLQILTEELRFLEDNRILGGKDQALNISTFKEASLFYTEKLTKITMDKIAHSKTIAELNKQRSDIQNQMNTLTSKEDFPTGEILIKVDAKSSSVFSMEINYIVGNAGWYPSYDIRAKSIAEPVEIIYKANIKQDTKVDWKNVKLKFSSSDPNVSGVAPKLQTYFLDYYTQPPVYNLIPNQIKGRVMDNNRNPLPGATVLVPGTTIGTVSDLDGNFNISIPYGTTQLEFKFLGYENKTQTVSPNFMNVILTEDNISLDEVVVIGYGTQRKNDISEALQGRVAGVSITNNNQLKIRGSNSMSIPIQQVVNQTTVDFEINTPYTIKSDNKSYSVDMAVYDLPADFQYYCVPKIDKSAFLMANIVDWEKYNLLEGEANIFFEDTYIGKTLLDVRYAGDTLQLSLGKDKSISVNREKVKEYTTKKFIGNKKVESRVWKTTIRNNKNQKINLLVLDQVPISTNEDITVDIQEVSKGELTPSNGEVKWKFSMEPGTKKEVELKYSVSYSKLFNLLVE